MAEAPLLELEPLAEFEPELEVELEPAAALAVCALAGMPCRASADTASAAKLKRIFMVGVPCNRGNPDPPLGAGEPLPLYGSGDRTMVKKFPADCAPELPLAPAAEPLRFAAPPIENEALFACVCDVLVCAATPTVPPGVVC